MESGAMYPATLLAAAVSSPTWSLDSIYLIFLGSSFLHYLLGACSMYLLLRRSFGISFAVALFGALAYAFGGSFLGRFSHQPILYCLAWLPLAVGGAMRFANTEAFGSAVLVIVAVWVMGVSSHPQVFLYALAVVTATVVWFSLTQDRALRWVRLRRGTIVLACALGFLAPRILPLYELSRVTVRQPSFTIAGLFDSLSPLYYLTLLVPGLFGRHTIGYWGTDHPWGNWGSLLYIGVLPALCAGFCFFHERRRDWAFALAGAAAAVFLMLGKHWTVSAWVNQRLPLSDVLTGFQQVDDRVSLLLRAAGGARRASAARLPAACTHRPDGLGGGVGRRRITSTRGGPPAWMDKRARWCRRTSPSTRSRWGPVSSTSSSRIARVVCSPASGSRPPPGSWRSGWPGGMRGPVAPSGVDVSGHGDRFRTENTGTSWAARRRAAR